jgi:hypothetical protein
VNNHVQSHHPVVPGVSAGIDSALGAAVVVFAALGAAGLPSVDSGWRLVVVAVALGLFSALTADALAAAFVGVLAWLIVNGFLVDRYGQLSWHGWADLVRLLVLAAAAGVGVVLGRSGRIDADKKKEV